MLEQTSQPPGRVVEMAGTLTVDSKMFPMPEIQEVPANAGQLPPAEMVQMPDGEIIILEQNRTIVIKQYSSLVIDGVTIQR